MTVRILHGDCREVLKTLPNASVHCVVTSPPYYGLRDYDVPPTRWPATEVSIFPAFPPLAIPAMECCLGLEPDPWAFIAHCVDIFREVRRVLRDDSTLWMNMGDSYATNGGPGWQGKNGQRSDRRFTGTRNTVAMREQSRTAYRGHKPKDLLGIPWMLAFALRADGWYLRQDIIWHKSNPMPESVRDRCTKAHEYLFLLSKSERYYFDAEAIAEARSSQHDAGVGGWAAGEGDHSPISHARDKGNSRTFRGGQYVNGNKFANSHATERTSKGNAPAGSLTRNKRSVWTIATTPFKEAHFATYPPELPKPCILAGCPAGGTVLDPFGGAGTTGLVADRLQRNAILIELKPENVTMSERRIRGDAPLLAQAGAA